MIIATRSKVVHILNNYHTANRIIKKYLPMFKISFGGWKNEKIPKQTFEFTPP